MPPMRGYEFYKKGQTSIDEEHIFMRWINGYQQSMSFVDFKRQLTGAELSEPQKEQTEEEILEKVKNILRGNINGNI